MDPCYDNDLNTAAQVLNVLDEPFHDYTQVLSARAKYNRLEMGSRLAKVKDSKASRSGW